MTRETRRAFCERGWSSTGTSPRPADVAASKIRLPHSIFHFIRTDR